MTVVGALLAFYATRQSVGLWTMGIVTAVFILFAAGSLSGMRDVSLQRAALKDSIVAYKTASGSSQDLLELRRRVANADAYYGVTGIRSYHLALDGATVLAVWVIAYRRRRHGAGSGHQGRGLGSN